MAPVSRLKLVAFWLATLVAPFALLEAGFRLATDPAPRRPRLFVKDGEVTPWVAPERYRVRHGEWEGVAPNLVYRYPSDPRGYFGPGNGVTYGTNALGLRGHLPVRDSGTRQVVFLGDSFTYGEGVRYEDLFVTLAAPLLQARALGGQRIETVNLGQPGLDTRAERLLLEYAAERVAPDLVVLVLVPNDWPSERLRGAHVIDAAEEIRKIHRAARRRGAEFAVVTLPELLLLDDRYPYRFVHEAVREIGRGEGVQVLDLLLDFAGWDPARLWVHESDHHPNEIAHRIIADRIGMELQTGFLRAGPP